MNQKRDKKRYILLCICTVLLLCACGETDVTKETASGGTEEAEEAVEAEQTEISSHTQADEITDKQLLDDIDGNGEAEYVIISGEAHDHLAFYFNQELIYEYDDPCYVDVGEAQYVDLDRDGEKEIFMTMCPHVNSMPLEEYAVLKCIDGQWKQLEIYQGDSVNDNAFPIHVLKGWDTFDVVISCDGIDKQIETDVLDYGRYLKEALTYEEKDQVEVYKNLIYDYETTFARYEEGEECGHVCAWGIWGITLSEYEGKPCLIANHGIEGFDKFDFWGNLEVYFDYNESGKIQILDIVFQLDEKFSPNEQLSEKETWGKLLCSAYQRGKLLDGTRLDHYGEEGTAMNHFAYMDIDGDGKNELILSWEYAAMAGMVTYIFDYEQGQIQEELCEFPSLTFYDNGIVIADWSHNQGMAGDFWPYNMYQYDAEKDEYKYIKVAEVDAWDRSLGEQNWDGTMFLEETDVDGDGMLYFILPPNWDGHYNDPVDGAAYQTWYDEHMTGATQIDITYQNLTKENIAEFGYPMLDVFEAIPLG